MFGSSAITISFHTHDCLSKTSVWQPVISTQSEPISSQISGRPHHNIHSATDHTHNGSMTYSDLTHQQLPHVLRPLRQSEQKSNATHKPLAQTTIFLNFPSDQNALKLSQSTLLGNKVTMFGKDVTSISISYGGDMMGEHRRKLSSCSVCWKVSLRAQGSRKH